WLARPPHPVLVPYTTLFRSKHLREVRGHQQDRLARRAGGAQLAVDELDRADVHAARWLRGQQHAKLARSAHLARDHDLVLIASRDRKSTRLNSSQVATSYAV